MTDKIKVLDFINTAKSARELLANRVTQVNATGRYENAICCSGGRYAESLREQGFDIRILEQPRTFAPVGILRAAIGVRSILIQDRISLLHTHGTLVGAIGRLAARLAGTPFVVHQVHGFHHHENMAAAASRVAVIVERIAAQGTHRLLFQNVRDLDDCIARRIAPRPKLIHIGNGVDLGEFTYTAPPLHDVPTILCVARFEPVKNHDMLLDAVSSLVDKGVQLTLNLVGDGPTRPHCEKRVHDSSMSGHVHFLGYRDDVARLTAEADICVLTSHKEGIPRAIIEAGACGRPVVATDVSGSRDAVIDGETGFLVPLGDPAELARRLDHLIGEPSLRSTIGLRAREHAESLFDETAVTNRIIEAYDDLVSW